MRALRPALLAAIFAFSSLPELAHASDSLDFSRSDHQLHATVSYGATLSTHLLFKELGFPAPQFFAAGLVLAAGFIKENSDPTFSVGDMSADAVGVTSATFFTLTFDL
jgi:hypothetical protein